MFMVSWWRCCNFTFYSFDDVLNFTLDIFFHPITIFIKVYVAFVFGRQTLQLIDFSKIYQLKGLKHKNKDNTNFYESWDLMNRKGISNFTCILNRSYFLLFLHFFANWAFLNPSPELTFLSKRWNSETKFYDRLFSNPTTTFYQMKFIFLTDDDENDFSGWSYILACHLQNKKKISFAKFRIV